MKTLMIGIGAAGNKCVVNAVRKGIVEQEDAVIVNSTSKDFPEKFEGKKIVLSSDNAGCGKERSRAKDYAITAIKAGKLNIEVGAYSTIILVTSVEGGTGSGSTPIIAKFLNQVYHKNVHIIAFTGFEEDVRGLGNTVEFFQEIDSNLVVHAISNAAFMRYAGGNKFKAEDLANDEMCKRFEIITGKNFIVGSQNIDDTDILKVSNTSGYMTVEHMLIDKPLVDHDDFNQRVRKMIYDSKSVKSNNPGAVRLGIILNVDPASEDAIDFSFSSIKNAYGNPYECFMQKQWDGKKEYIAIIASGMQMPIDELKAIYERYKENTAKVMKNADAFFNAMQEMTLDAVDKKFDMYSKTNRDNMSIDEFFKGMETK